MMVDPDPLRKPPRAPAGSPARITSIEKRDQLFAKRLVQMIDKCAAQILVITRDKRGGDGSRRRGEDSTACR